MSAAEQQDRAFFQGEWAWLEQVVERFEEAWRRGERPAVEAYLPAGGGGLRELILELVHADLECRLKAGEAARVEAYLGRYAQLADDRAGVLRLIEAEYRLRRRREPGLGPDEYLRRFPHYGQELVPLLEDLPAQKEDGGRGDEGPGGWPQTWSWDASPSGVPPPPSFPGGSPRLGQFELLEVVGQGAFGTVYRARDVELGRIVAVKVPRLDYSLTPADVERFLREARSAAGLSHPGIVPVYEVSRAGAVPYIVGAYVQGITLAEALDRHRLDSREAARVVAQLAEALDHAHRHGVIHRDLKPSNIMLGQIQGAGQQARSPAAAGGGGDGAPGTLQVFVMDFGLAWREEGEARLTVEGQLLGTPGYMSPEQARGQGHRVDARSDVWGLGAILYELLTGELPFRGTARMVLQQILGEEPRPPRRLNDRVPRDLETITLKCMAKEPGRRYATAADLAADLRRHLNSEPILARPVGALGRGWRWARRNPRVAVLSAAVLLLLAALAVGSVIATVQIEQKRQAALFAQREAEQSAEVADKRFEQALDALGKLIDEVQEQLRAQRGVKESLLRTAAAGLERVTWDAEGMRAERSVVFAHQRLGNVFLALGRTAEARKHFQRCRSMVETLATSEPHSTRLKWTLCVITAKLGEVSRREGDANTARACCRKALALAQELADADPDNVLLRRDLSGVYGTLGEVSERLGDSGAARESYSKALALAQELADADPDNAPLRRDLSVAYLKVGEVSERLGDAGAARGYYRKALDRFEGLAAADPPDARARRDVAVAHLKLGSVTLHMGDAKAARAYRLKAQACFEGLAAANPDSVQAQADLVAAYGTSGRAEMQAHAYAEAAGYFERGMTILNRLKTQGKLKDQPAYQNWLRTQQQELSLCKAAIRAIDDLDFALAQPVARAKRLLVIRAAVLAGRGRYADATASAEKLRALGPADSPSLYDVACCYALCAAGVAPGKAVDRLAPEESEARRHYTTRALQSLAEAVRRGYRDVDRMEADPDLAAVRSEREYRRLVADLREGH